MKQYVLRNRRFFYDDYYSYIDSYPFWKLHSQYTSQEEAEKARNYWEIKAMRQTEIALCFGLYGTFSTWNEEFNKRKEMMTQYFLENFLIEVIDWRGGKYIEKGELYGGMFIYPPQYATDAQVMEIQSILGIEFYGLIEFEGEIQFYRPLMNKKFWGDDFHHRPFTVEYHGHIFFNSKEEAITFTPRLLAWILRKYEYSEVDIQGFHGALESLSTNPIAFKNFLDNSLEVGYNEEDQKIFLRKWVDENSQDWITLFEFLTIKPCALQPISYRQAEELMKSYWRWWYGGDYRDTNDFSRFDDTKGYVWS